MIAGAVVLFFIYDRTIHIEWVRKIILELKQKQQISVELIAELVVEPVVELVVELVLEPGVEPVVEPVQYKLVSLDKVNNRIQ